MKCEPAVDLGGVSVTVEALKDLPSRVSVIVAPFAKPLIVTVVVARSSASPPTTLIGSETEVVPFVHFTEDGPDNTGAVATSLTVTACGASTVDTLPA